ncbi:MAG: hypothetical protein WBE90_01355 [Xanthobacteraceae bacterium]
MTDDDRDKIERVAKAIKEAWAAMGHMPFPLYQDEALALARAAIKALRD